MDVPPTGWGKSEKSSGIPGVKDIFRTFGQSTLIPSIRQDSQNDRTSEIQNPSATGLKVYRLDQDDPELENRLNWRESAGNQEHKPMRKHLRTILVCNTILEKDKPDPLYVFVHLRRNH